VSRSARCPHEHTDLLIVALCEHRALTTKLIYAWLQDNFEYFRTNAESKAWRNAIRRTLSAKGYFATEDTLDRGSRGMLHCLKPGTADTIMQIAQGRLPLSSGPRWLRPSAIDLVRKRAAARAAFPLFPNPPRPPETGWSSRREGGAGVVERRASPNEHVLKGRKNK